MRPLIFLTDLPWWTGLPIFLIGTGAVLLFYPLGIIIALFGAWTFYKLMEPSDWKEPGVIMAGSVGQPREEHDRRAAWVLWEPDIRRIQLMRTDYSRITAAKEIIMAGLPLESALRILTQQEYATLIQ
jgi:hypothetical protein